MTTLLLKSLTLWTESVGAGRPAKVLLLLKAIEVSEDVWNWYDQGGNLLSLIAASKVREGGHGCAASGVRWGWHHSGNEVEKGP